MAAVLRRAVFAAGALMAAARCQTVHRLAAGLRAGGPCVHVLIPCFECGETLPRLAGQIVRARRAHTCTTALVMFDGPPGEGVEAAAMATLAAGGVEAAAIHSRERLGPAHSKWRLFEAARAMFAPNDYVMLVDADDAFADSRVVGDVARALSRTGAWVATGMIRGPYSEQCAVGWPSDVPVRAAPWSFCHPRTMRVGLLRLFDASMFKMGGEWLQKVTDRSWVYAALDAATHARYTRVVSRALVVYEARADNTASRVSNAYRLAAIAHAKSFPPRAAHAEVHLVTVVHARTAHLGEWLRANAVRQAPALARAGLTLHLHLVCQSPAAARVAEAACAPLPFACNVEHHVENNGPWSRYTYMRDHYRVWLTDYFVMLDDDLLLQRSNALAVAFASRAPRTMSCWYGKVFDTGDDYWTDRYYVNSMRAAMYGACPGIRAWDYCGAGFAVVDASFFHYFDEMSAIAPPRYRDMEDIASSCLLTLLGWRKVRLMASVEDINYRSRADQSAALWSRTTMRLRKSTYFRLLQARFPWPMEKGGTDRALMAACNATHGRAVALRAVDRVRGI